nr:alpha/beta hydrolase [Oculatella sp. LEGE 06141]
MLKAIAPSPFFKPCSLIWMAGLGAALSLPTRAIAAETVLFQYDDIRMAVPAADVRALADEGKLSEPLEQLFQQIPETPDAIQATLTNSIRIRPSLIEQNLRLSGDGEFILLQLNKVIGAPLGREDLESLQTALIEASRRDRSLSVMEVIEAYPQPAIEIKLRNLAIVYDNVRAFVDRIEPLFGSSDFVEDWLCECDDPVSSPAATDQSQTSFRSQRPMPDRANACTMLLSPHQDWNEAAIASDVKPPIAAVPSNPVNPLSSKPFELPIVSPTAAQNDSLISAVTAPSNLDDKRLVVVFGPLRPSFSIAELAQFAETGEASRSLQFYLNIANLEAEEFRTALTQQLSVSYRFLDSALNTLLGEFLLFRVGQILQTPSGRANIQALRAAIVLSAIEDDNISFLELLQHYPLQRLYINGLTLLRTTRATNDFIRSGGSDLEDWLVDVQASLASRVCDCPSP